MRELTMDASEWRTLDELYLSFFRAVGAPDWHGRNLDAVRDSVGAGSINQIEVPYRLVVKNYRVVDPAMRETSDIFIEVIRELAQEGVPVEIRVED
jgi:RNAse (barnase) inhibitor barstar